MQSRVSTHMNTCFARQRQWKEGEVTVSFSYTVMFVVKNTEEEKNSKFKFTLSGCYNNIFF